jgi:hypothetical protein
MKWPPNPTTTSPLPTWTFLIWSGVGDLDCVALSSVFTALVGANYTRTASLDATADGTPRPLKIGTVATAIQVATSSVAVAGGFSVDDQAGGLLTIENGDVALDCNGSMSIGGNAATLRICNNETSAVNIANGDCSVTISSASLLLAGLPNSDPHISGHVWISAGTLKISDG